MEQTLHQKEDVSLGNCYSPTEQGIGNQETPTYPTQIWKKKERN